MTHHLYAGPLIITFSALQPHAPHNLEPVPQELLDHVKLVKVKFHDQRVFHIPVLSSLRYLRGLTTKI